MARFTDGVVIADIIMRVWDPDSSSYLPDWSNDFFEVGGLKYNDDFGAYKVEDIDYLVDRAKDWAFGEDASDSELATYLTEEEFKEDVDNRDYDVTYYSVKDPYGVRFSTYDKAAAK